MNDIEFVYSLTAILKSIELLANALASSWRVSWLQRVKYFLCRTFSWFL